MRSTTRYKLHGTYNTPRCRMGARVLDAVRGQVVITELTDAAIPWPVGKIGGNRSLVVYGGLARAIRRESIVAVAHNWGVSPQTVVKWRRLLGLTGKKTPGTTALRAEYFREPWAERMRRKAWAKARDPERREKIAAAKRGKPRASETVEKMRAAATDRTASAATRRKMSVAHKARGTRPPKAGRPWAPAEEALLAKMPPAEVAQRTGRTLQAVYQRRNVKRIQCG